MPNPTPSVELTERFLGEQLPDFFDAEARDIDEAFAEYMGHVLEVAGPRREFESRFAWGEVKDIAEELSPVNSEDESAKRKRATNAGGDGFVLGIGYERLVTNSSSSFFRTQPPEETTTVKTTGKGTLILVDELGHIKAGRSEHNERVNSAYGDPTHYVLEKLGWARLIELKAHQGADWGEGYDVLTDYLRGIGRIKVYERPHVGMATAHEAEYDETAVGTDRHALAYASASNYTITLGSAANLLDNKQYFEMYKKDVAEGLFDNLVDWLAGRLDSLVARRAYELYLGRWIIRAFPDLSTPDFAGVDNN